MNIRWALRDTVEWATQTGELDDRAQPVLEPKGAITARVLHKAHLVASADGREVVSTIQVYVLDPVLLGDQITIDGQAYRVIDRADGKALYAGKASFYILYL